MTNKSAQQAFDEAVLAMQTETLSDDPRIAAAARLMLPMLHALQRFVTSEHDRNTEPTIIINSLVNGGAMLLESALALYPPEPGQEKVTVEALMILTRRIILANANQWSKGDANSSENRMERP
ncbi:MAG: hypothetical protein GDA50_04050 [Alphaproteobacteria bacterium GM202ARS2]|nr:hypothetical protein [Alphaproteobacteria bacterium GM202ARS2]